MTAIARAGRRQLTVERKLRPHIGVIGRLLLLDRMR